jgi:hypothetical protein
MIVAGRRGRGIHLGIRARLGISADRVVGSINTRVRVATPGSIIVRESL